MVEKTIKEYNIRFSNTVSENATFQQQQQQYDFIDINNVSSSFQQKYQIEIVETTSDKVLKKALISDNDIVSTINEKTICLNDSQLCVCCGKNVYCFTIPELQLKWKIQLDKIKCLEIVSCREGYIVHSEQHITLVSSEGEVRWQQSGNDLFSLPTNEDHFYIDNNFIYVKDWSNKRYVFD